MLRRLAILLIPVLAAQLPAYAQKGNGAADAPPEPGLVSRATPQADPASWILDSDYPPNALRAELGGQVGLVLQIGADGRVSNCTVLTSSGASLLDNNSCDLVTRRARFTPAMGKDRNPAPDRWKYTIIWKVPPGPVQRTELESCSDCGLPWAAATLRLASPEPLGDPELWLQGSDYPAALRKNGGSVEVVLTVARSGRTRRCQIVASSGMRAWDRQVCSILRRHARFKAEREAEEKWVSHYWQHRYSWGQMIAR